MGTTLILTRVTLIASLVAPAWDGFTLVASVVAPASIKYTSFASTSSFHFKWGLFYFFIDWKRLTEIQLVLCGLFPHAAEEFEDHGDAAVDVGVFECFD